MSAYRVETPRERNAGVLESLATMVTMTYGRYQADAGRRVGILPGEAWRVAFETAAKTKTPYIFLGDRCASITAERLLKAMIASSLPLFLAGAVVSTASWFTPPLLLNMQSSLPATLATTVVSMATAAWPLISPILEIKAFSELSAREIENAVRVNEPLQSPIKTEPFYLWGEDALIRWPGAEQPVIGERDEYMARAILGFLDNNTSDLTPTYVATSEESYGATIYSYAMPKNASRIVCPSGKGQGQFDLGTGNPKTVVAIVGTAHVRGMIHHVKSGYITRTLEELSM
jgi:pheromone shutdown protein TraB